MRYATERRAKQAMRSGQLARDFLNPPSYYEAEELTPAELAALRREADEARAADAAYWAAHGRLA